MLESKQTFQQVIGSLNKKAGFKSRSIRLVCLFLLILSLLTVTESKSQRKRLTLYSCTSIMYSLWVLTTDLSVKF